MENSLKKKTIQKKINISVFVNFCFSKYEFSLFETHHRKYFLCPIMDIKSSTKMYIDMYQLLWDKISFIHHPFQCVFSIRNTYRNVSTIMGQK